MVLVGQVGVDGAVRHGQRGRGVRPVVDQEKRPNEMGGHVGLGGREVASALGAASTSEQFQPSTERLPADIDRPGGKAAESCLGHGVVHRPEKSGGRLSKKAWSPSARSSVAAS